MPPFDHEHSLLPLEATAICQIEVEGQTREFLLKVIGNWVYFTPALQLDYEPVFGIATRFEGGDLVEFFKREFERGNWGLMREFNGVLWFWQPCGTVLLRSYWNDETQSLDWPGIENWSLDDWLNISLETHRENYIWTARAGFLCACPPAFPKSAFRGWEGELKKWPRFKLNPQQFKEQTAHLTPTESDCPTQNLRWVLGDQESLRRKINMVFHACLTDQDWAEERGERDDVTVHFECASPIEPMRLTPVLSAETGDLRFDFLLHLLERQFIARGWEWSREFGFLQLKSESWSHFVSPPSAHEKLEAQLALGEWLQELETQGELDAQDAKLIREWPFGELNENEKTDLDFQYSALYSRLFSPFPREADYFRAQWEREREKE